MIHYNSNKTKYPSWMMEEKLHTVSLILGGKIEPLPCKFFTHLLKSNEHFLMKVEIITCT